MNYKNTISRYESCKSSGSGKAVSMIDFCFEVMKGSYKSQVEAVRNATDKKQRSELKKTIPAVTVSGLFSERKKSGLISHSGFIAVDLDAQDNPTVKNWSHARDNIATLKNVFFAALSVSGNGVFVIIPIQDPAKHEQHFDSLKNAFQSLGYKIDGSGRDVSRLRFISFDPEAKLNVKAKTYGLVYSAPKIHRDPPQRNNEDSLDRMIDKILRSGADITGGYENWLTVGRAIANEKGEAGRSDFHRLSQANEAYKQGECDRKYDDCLRVPGSASEASIFYLAKQYGITLK